jgi:hypothetical protein
MKNYSKNVYRIFVIDQITFGILTEVSSMSIANAVCKGILNTSQMVVSIDTPLDLNLNYILTQSKIVQKHGEANAAKIIDKVENHKRYGLEIFDPDEVFLEKKKLAENRKYGIDLLEKNITRFLSRNNIYADNEGLMSVLSVELPKCDINKNFYTPAIREWAIASKVDNFTAYNFLKMQYDCFSASTLRFYALWIKYVDKINQLSSKRDIHMCALYEFEHEVYASGEGE